MKIICVAYNYDSNKENAEKNNREEFSNPVLYLKPETALLKADSPFFLPDFSSNIICGLGVVIRINRVGKNISKRFAYRYYEELSVGIDLSALDLYKELREKKLSWEISKGFDGSAIVGSFVRKDETEISQGNLNFSLLINGEEVENNNIKNIIYSIDDIIAFASKYYTLKIGDLIFTGSPYKSERLNINDKLEGLMNNNKLLDLDIR